jgi:hypothetical protein
MVRSDLVRANATGSGLRLCVSTLAVVLLPPFIAIAAVPLALLLFPVAWLAIPFIITNLLGDVVAAGAQPKQVARNRARRKLAHAAAVQGVR